MKAVDIEDGKQHTIVYDEYTSATVHRNDSKVAIDFYIAGGLVKATEEYSNIVNAKSAGNESLFRLQDIVRQRFIDNDYSQEELDSIKKIKQESSEPQEIKPVIEPNLEPNEPGRIYKQAERVTIGDGRYTIERIDLDAKTATFASSDGSERFTLSKSELDDKELLIDGIHSTQEQAANKGIVSELKPLIKDLDSSAWFNEKGFMSLSGFDAIYDALIANGYNADTARIKARQVMDEHNNGETKYQEHYLEQATQKEPQVENEITSIFGKPRLAQAVRAVVVNGNKDIVSSLETINDIDNDKGRGLDRSLFVQSIVGKVKTMHKNGLQGHVDNVLTLLHEYNSVALKAAVTPRNGVWKLGEVREILLEGDAQKKADEKQKEETGLNETDQRIKDSEDVTGQQANFWYGMRIRPFGIGSQPDNHAAFVNNEEALTKFADKSVKTRDVRFGAVGYQAALSQDVIDQYNLTDLNADQEINMDLGDQALQEITFNWVKEKTNNSMLLSEFDSKAIIHDVSSNLQKTKSLFFALAKTDLSSHVRNMNEFQAKSSDPDKYRIFQKSIDAQPLDSLVELIESYVSDEQPDLDDTKAAEANKPQSEAVNAINALNPNEFTKGSIYNKESIVDLKEISSRIRKSIAALKKADTIPKSTKISVTKSGENLHLNLTDIGSDVPVFSYDHLWSTAQGDSPSGNGYSVELNQLIEYINAMVSQYNKDTDDDSDQNFVSAGLLIDPSFAELRKKEELKPVQEKSDDSDSDAGVQQEADNDNAEQEEENDVSSNDPVLDAHLETIASIKRSEIPDRKTAMDKLRESAEYIKSRDLADEYEADIAVAADAITAMLAKEASKIA